MKKWKLNDYPDTVFISVLAKSSSKQIHLHHVEKSDIKILHDIAEMWKTYNAGKYTTLVYNEKGEEKWRYDHKPGHFVMLSVVLCILIFGKKKLRKRYNNHTTY